MSRISVVVNDEIVPLLSATPLLDSRFSPWKGLLVEKHSVGAIEVPEHEHSTFCLHMQTSGPVEMQWRSDGHQGREITTPGSLILLTPGTRDTIRWDGPSRRVIVSLDDALLGRASQELELPQPLSFQNHWAFEDRQLRLLLSEILREMEDGWTMGPLYGDHLGMALSLALVRKYGHAAPVTLPQKPGLTQPHLRRVLDYIAQYSHTNLRLADLAQVSGTSTFHFARLFREATGVPPHQYLMQQRIARAKTLLRSPGHNVIDVAAATGFVSPSHFAKTFRRIVGVTPTEWKSKS
jgi:AraC family transcriptional regulator